MRERTKALAFVAVWLTSLLVLVAAMGRPADLHAPAAGIRVDLTVRGDGWTIEYRPEGTLNGTVFSILREANETLGFDLRWVEYGWPYDDVYVTSINGSRNDGSRGLWWQYCVNGEYASQGAQHQEVRDGDAVLWTYAPPGGVELCG